MLGVESPSYLMLHVKNPGLFCQDEDGLLPPTEETYANVCVFSTLGKHLRGKCRLRFPQLEGPKAPTRTLPAGRRVLGNPHRVIRRLGVRIHVTANVPETHLQERDEDLGSDHVKAWVFLIFCIWNIFCQHRFFYAR